MKEEYLSKAIAGVCTLITAYIAFLVFRDIEAVYRNYMAWSGGSSVQATMFSIFLSLSVVFSAGITFLIYLQKRNWILVLLTVHVLIAFMGWPSTLLALSVMFWWFSKRYYIKP
ncbi:hypothetical protein [Teredinibacter sp. KSP-S5-2]|uniref:hypothetical protein n=1 Tax=Teredinibacter sp. KSP-S5-2 TaxID=3034506 RepID=UPI002934C067|nr:hypothetical protein [Teredinibacter sp. KSP-S5-2]WNO10619.1 hypothetical protein P5V12_05470 [Teredinibacter sp. KSP-S5-2]